MVRHLRLYGILILLLMVGYSIFTSSATFTRQTKLEAQRFDPGPVVVPDGGESHYFGNAVASSHDGNTLLVGARFANGLVPVSGAAYVYTRNNGLWTLQAKLQANDGTTNDGFGFSAALSADGNTALIGARGEHAAYVFVRSGSTWTQQQKLLSGRPPANFGHAVALSDDGNKALVSNYTDAPTMGEFNDGAAVYFFTRSSNVWTQQQRFETTNDNTGDYFGASLALNADGTTALVGAPLGDSENVNFTGAAYVFGYNGVTWSEVVKLTPSDGAGFDYFGNSVAYDGGTAVIGAPQKNSQGAVYIFRPLTEEHKLTETNVLGSSSFGSSVAVSSDGLTVLVGASGSNGPINNATGMAYIFAGPNWIEQQKLFDEEGAPADGFGNVSTLSGNGATAFVSAFLDNTTAGEDAGTVYVTLNYGVTLTENGGSTVVTESGASDSYALSLNASPSGNLVITADPDTQCDIGAGMGNPVDYTFTPSLYTPLTITVSAVDDTLVEGGHQCVITHAVNPVGTTDGNYTGYTIAPVTVTVNDNDSNQVTSTFTAQPFTPTPGSATTTPTPLPFGSVELLKNGGFEIAGESVAKPEQWTFKKVFRDKRKCDTATTLISHQGSCAFLFRGSVGENAKLIQLPDLTGYVFEEGDVLSYTVQYRTRGTSAPRLKLKLAIVVGDTTIKRIGTSQNATGQYKLVTAESYVFGVDAATITSIKAVIQHKTLVGKVFIDDASVVFDPADDDPTK